MSTNPYWEPIIDRKKSLPYEIKCPMARKYQDHDGSLSGKTRLDDTDIPYLEGLRDGGNKNIRDGAILLIDAIKKYDEILFIIDE